LYETTSVDERTLLEIAKEEHLDRAGFESCLRAEATTRNLDEQIQAGVADGVKATPTVLINGRRHRGTFDPRELACLLGERTQ